MFNKLQAWIELIKLGRIGSVNSDVSKFYRGNIIRALEKEGWFEYLDVPRGFDEITEHFHYTDKILLKEVLDALIKDKSLKYIKGVKYQNNGHTHDGRVLPRLFNEAMIGVSESLAQALPDRLRGIYHSFGGGFDLYNWDDAVTARVYGQIRRSAFAFAGALKKPGKFLDVGCASGYGTAAVWTFYKKRNHFYPGSPMKIWAIDPEESLVEIARAEFPRWVAKNTSESTEDIRSMKQYFPEFAKGRAEEIPFSNDTFDYVFTSATLHWTDAEQAVKEMLRVTKRKGIVFGTARLFPHADRFPDLHTKVVKGAHGFFFAKDFKRWAKNAGASKIGLATPVSVFRIEKA